MTNYLLIDDSYTQNKLTAIPLETDSLESAKQELVSYCVEHVRTLTPPVNQFDAYGGAFVNGVFCQLRLTVSLDASGVVTIDNQRFTTSFSFL